MVTLLLQKAALHDHLFAKIRACAIATHQLFRNMSTPPIEVIVLAAGKGSRMQSALPKVLHQVAGKPLLGHVLDAARQLRPHKIHVVIGHAKEQLLQAFAEPDINWVEQAEQLGTGHAVQQAMPLVDATANVLMLTADVPLISANTLHDMTVHMEAYPLALLTAEVENPAGLGRILRNGDSVVGIIEDKDCNAAQHHIKEINSGIMCARAADLNGWLKQLGKQNAQGEYYLTDIVDLAYQAGCPIAALQPRDNAEVQGINTRAQLAAVERAYQRLRAAELMASGVTIVDPTRIDIRGDVEIGQDTVLDINTIIIGPTKIGANVAVGPNCVIKACEIDDHSIIHATSVLEQAKIGQQVNIGPFARLRPGTVLADEVRIGNFVETKNAKFSQGAKANHLSYVGDATVGAHTNIGAGVITCNYDGANKHQTTIGADVFVGSDCQLVAPVSIGDGATIGAGSTITNAVGDKQLAVSRGRQRQIDGWQRPIKKPKS